MSPRSEEFMAMARDRLGAARAAIRAGFPSSAAGDAYYAMLYAARAALSEEDRYARTHSGTWGLFRDLFVVTGRFDRELLRRAQETQELREAADYEARFVQTEQAEEVLDLAQQFVEAVADLFD